LKGFFIGCGYVAEPTAESRLELRVRTQMLADDIDGLLAMIMLPPNKTVRRAKPVLLYKKSTSIENFLGFIGADTAVLELMSEKPVKELRADTNRRLNLETSGINRSIKTAVKQTTAIKALMESGLINGLSAEIRQTAKLRLEYGSLSLEQLALKHEPPITKSGLNHRLAKIMELAKKLEKQD
jgi:DNA-binding protein WhiA